MSNLTIQSIIVRNSSAREGQKELRALVYKKLPLEDKLWENVVTAAKGSCLVNYDHTNSRSMKSVSVSQILDRMNCNSLAILLKMFADYTPEEAVTKFANEFWTHAMYDKDKKIHRLDEVNFWPFIYKGNIYHAYELRVSDLLGENSEPPETKPVEKKYDVTADIASAADVLLKVATKGEMDNLQALLDEVTELRKRPTTVAKAPSVVQANGVLPKGQAMNVKASTLFDCPDHDGLLDFMVTCYEWEGKHPLVPEIDDTYKFNASHVCDVLWSWEHNLNSWLTGSTGTGKSTLVAQICARVGRPLVRTNMDSAVERPDFVGSMAVVTDDNGNQVTKFKDGILPRAMQSACVLLLDEMDAVRADIAYVLQPVLEGQPLRLLEDGGRIVHRHPDFQIVATANTTGSGDSTGMYASAVKVQSRAMLNRFSTFIEVDYMSIEDEMEVVRAQLHQGISDKAGDMLTEFLTQYRKGFAEGTIGTPISPRNSVALGRYVADFEPRIGTEKAIKRALSMNILLTIDEADAAAVRGLMDRITP